MKAQTIKTPNFSSKIAKIMEEICTETCINDVDNEIIKAILQDMLIEECRMLAGYYEEEYQAEYYNAIDSVRSSAYDEGYADGANA